MYRDNNILLKSYQKALFIGGECNANQISTEAYVDLAFVAYAFFDDETYARKSFEMREEEFYELMDKCIAYFENHDSTQEMSSSLDDIFANFEAFLKNKDCEHVMEKIFTFMKLLWIKYKQEHPNITDEAIFLRSGIQTRVQKKQNIVKILKDLLPNEEKYKLMLYSPLPVARYLGYIQ